MNLDYAKLVENVQAELSKSDAAKSGGGAIYREKLSLKIGNEYLLRIVPYLKDGMEHFTEKTFYRYYRYGWREVETGKWCFVKSPRTIGERCPISEWSNNYRKTASKEAVEKLRNLLSFREGHYINVYVVSDPENPDNNGRVKILECSKTVWDVIEKALRGGLDDDWSQLAGKEVKVAQKIFDLSDEGVTLSIKVKENKQMPGSPDYSDTRFLPPNASKLNLAAERQEEIINSAYDLSQVDRIMTYDELAEKFKATFLPKLKDGGAIPVGESHTPEAAPQAAAAPKAAAAPGAAAASPSPGDLSAGGEVETADDLIRRLGL